MAEEIKEEIYEFLKEHTGESFSVSKLKEKIGHSYNTVLKWIMVLAENPEKDIVVKDYGNIKLVYYAGSGKNST